MIVMSFTSIYSNVDSLFSCARVVEMSIHRDCGVISKNNVKLQSRTTLYN